MESKAKAKYIRISPRKARRITSLIKGRLVLEALDLLELTPKKAARLVKKVLKSALANAEQRYPEIDTKSLIVKHAVVDGGPILWRILPRARGRADWIRKRTSHITIVVGDK